MPRGRSRSRSPSQEAEDEKDFVPEKVKKANKRIEKHPFDPEAWSVLLRNAQMQIIDISRPVFERLVAQFPTCGKYWKTYIEQEIKVRNYEKVEKLFQRCLMKVLNIDLWKSYLHYIKETKSKLPTYREKMAQAFDFALDKIGMDVMSYSIWADYISFLKGVEAVGSYAENQRISAVRKVYQRGVVNPMLNLETLWKDYCNYENGINPLIAKKMTEERSRDYMNARRVTKELEIVVRGLDRNMPSTPPSNSPGEAKQVEAWKKYIAWEKSNPVRTDDHALITRRVMFAYEQCLLCLGHHPDIWYEAASYLEQSSKLLTDKGDQNAAKVFADEAASMYERAITSVLKRNILLYFAYADFEESRMKYEKVHSIYKKCLELEAADPSLTHVQYMKFARRTEGIKSARLVFKIAREDPRSKYQVFVAAALMEYYCSKDKNIAFKIFELGLKRFGDVPEYIGAYIDYMSHLNEDNNTRVLFERVLSNTSLSPEHSKDIWTRFLDFESSVGDLASIMKVEKRRLQVFEKLNEHEGKETAMLVDRYRFMDLYPCTAEELKALGYKDHLRHHHGPAVGHGALSDKKDAAPLEEDEEERPKYPKPDVQQMLPFKPRAVYPVNSHPVAGGVFPLPPVASEVLALLPPPTNFHGPFVDMDRFLENFKDLELLPPKPTENGENRAADAGTAFSIEISTRKRKYVTESGGNNAMDDSDDDENSAAPPLNDLYRLRQQQKRVK